MYQPIKLTTTVSALRNSNSRALLRRGVLLIALVLPLACFALSPMAQAVTPAPDGGYANGNTAEGDNALFSLTSGSNNTANGAAALYSNTTGSSNTANGYAALFSNTNGFDNTAIGYAALDSNTIGFQNTATGFEALFNNNTGYNNTANGFVALFHNTIGFDNTATGFRALYSNTTGVDNTANGGEALYSNNTGFQNTATGWHALHNNTIGSDNIALGYGAGQNLTTGNNNIDIGNEGVAGDSDTIRIGIEGTQTKAFIAGIHGVGVTGTAVVVNSSGQLGVAPSSERFKDGIEPMGKASEALLSLRPVTFRYKKNIDPKGAPQFGLVAEEVEKVNPDLVVRDAEGKVFTVRYEAVNAMLLNEFLKEHRKLEQLTKDFESKLAEQQKQIKALSSCLEKINNQLELNKPAPQMVAKNR